MDPYSSGEDLVIKTRKPYTITKQRERWTEEEHNRFLEALKLYGRAWQRIEEHIGTKTAVQIRSHAQKFFTKLEKEATGKGVSIGHAIDIDIPPPRPKRKPSNPYPRKKGAEAPNPQMAVKNGNKPCSVSSSCHSKLTIALEKEPGEEPNDDEKSDYRNNENRTVPCPSLSPADSLRKPCTFTQYVPFLKEASDLDGTVTSQITVESNGMKSDHKKLLCNVSNAADSNLTSNMKSLHCEKTDEHIGKTSTVEMQVSTNNYPHPISTLDGSLHVNHHQSNNTSISSNEPLSSYHPPIFTPIQNQEDYHHSFLHVSSVFSSLIISALSQNPASYAAARFAATLWPCMNNMEAPVVGVGGGLPSTASASSTPPLNHSPSVSAIAAATVGAATAWWAANGLLPPLLCTPFQPLMSNTQGRPENGPDNIPSVLLGQQQLEPECPEFPFTMNEKQKQQSVPKSPAVSSSESETSADAKCSVVEAPSKNVDTEARNTAKNKKPEKPADRSSCGSNSDVEADAKGEEDYGKLTNEKEVSEDPSSRRCRSTTSNVNDSWKEVSEDGRLAFQALFSREVLPQSFLPLHNDVKNKGKKMLGKENGVQVDLNVTRPQKEEGDGNVPLIIGNTEEEILNMGVGVVKLKARRTGFKPYKRCSMEGKDSRDEEKCPKRLRIEGEGST